MTSISAQVTIVDAELTEDGFPAASLQPRPAEVFYLGGNYERYLRLRRNAPPGLALLPTGSRLNAIARATLDDYRDLDSHLDADIERDLWDATDLAERSQLNSDFHYRGCCLLFFHECLRDAAVRLFVVEDPLLAARLARRAHANGSRVLHLKGPRSAARRPSLRNLLRGRWDAVSAGMRRLRAMRRARRQNPVPVDALRACDLLMVLWGAPATFAADGRLQRDDYFGALPGLLRSLGRRPAFLVLPIDWVYAYGEVVGPAVRSRDPVLVLHDLLRASDIVSASWRVARFVLRARPRVVIGGIDLSVEARDALLAEATRPRIDAAMLLARVGPALASLGVAPEVIVHLYENQSWEKCLRRGVRESLPQTGLVGCMHQPASELFVSFLPTRDEVTRGDLPDCIAAPGPLLEARLRAGGVPPDRVLVGGAVRPPRVSPAMPHGGAGAEDGRVRCLVATGIEYQSTLELMDKSLDAARLDVRLSLLVNFHPRVGSMFVERLRAELLRLHGESALQAVEFCEGSVSSLLPRAQVLLYNVSAAALEAVAAGVPAIFVAPDLGLALDKLPQGMSVKVTTVEQLANAASAAASAADRGAAAAAAADTLASWFAPLDAVAWSRMTAPRPRCTPA